MNMINDESGVTVWTGIISDEFIPSSEMRQQITKTVKEIWQLLIPKTPQFVDRIDLVSEGLTAQMTPLVTYRGVTIRLDLGGCFYFDEECWNEEESDYFYSLVMHEIWHFADRLNSEFAINYHEESVRDYKKYRTMVNAAWDIYIERRKLVKFAIYPFNWYINQNKNYRDAAIDEPLSHPDVKKYISSAKPYFHEIWDTKKEYTWMDFYKFAKKCKH